MSESISEQPHNRRTKWWYLCGSQVPSDEIEFFCQIIICYIVIITCIVNLSLKNGDSNLWTALLSGTLGFLLPGPRLKDFKSTVHA